jgi:hypothetical protein
VLPPQRAAAVATEPLAARAVGAKTGQLLGVIGRDLEEPGPHAIHHHREQPPELVLHRGELPHQRREIHGQTRAVNGRQGNRFEQPDRLAGEDRDALRGRQVCRRSEIPLHAVEVARDFFLNASLESEARKRL